MGKLEQGMEALRIMCFFEGLEAGTEWKPGTWETGAKGGNGTGRELVVKKATTPRGSKRKLSCLITSWARLSQGRGCP